MSTAIFAETIRPKRFRTDPYASILVHHEAAIRAAVIPAADERPFAVGAHPLEHLSPSIPGREDLKRMQRRENARPFHQRFGGRSP